MKLGACHSSRLSLLDQATSLAMALGHLQQLLPHFLEDRHQSQAKQLSCNSCCVFTSVCAASHVTCAGCGSVEEAILRDVPRTFPEHPFFSTQDGQQKLLRVLTAYAAADPEVGGDFLLLCHQWPAAGLTTHRCKICAATGLLCSRVT